MEVHIMGLARESVDAQRVIRGTEAGLAAIAVHLLIGDHGGAAELPSPIVLSSGLKIVLGALGADREALELERGEALVQTIELLGYSR